MDVGLSGWKARLRPLLISLFLTVVLLFLVEVAGNIILDRFFPLKQIGTRYWRNPMAYIIFFLPLLPPFIGSYMVEPSYQPFGVLGTTLGSVLFVFIWDLLYYPTLFGINLWLLLVGEHNPDTIFNYLLVGLIMGFLGWFVRTWKEKRTLSLSFFNNPTTHHRLIQWMVKTLTPEKAP